MNAILDPEIHEVINAVHYRPALSIILPLEPHIGLETEIAHTLKITADKAERELHRYYPDEQCRVVTQKLQRLIAGVDIPVKKKGMALFVSPLFEKVLYLDYPVMEKLVVDESFKVRDLLYDAKQDVRFILLVLSALESKVFLGDHTTLTPLPSNIPGSIYAYMTDMPERISNFSDIGEHKQIVIDKFLHHIDEELGNLINERHLPVLVLGAERILGQFKKLSRNTRSVMAYVDGNYENATIVELTELVRPHLRALKMTRQQELLQRLDKAAGQHRIATGIQQVWRDAHDGKGQLLIVEKNYRFAAQHGPEPGIIEAATEPYDHFAYIRDAVDDAMEKVLISGGDVEFTEDGALEHFDHIALIKYYQ
ncbi:hypothetical protein BEL04_07000 [Mucilaginibacter sp. PPCGB 2223]|uniref:baeRF3 domain-containing protein n=1 Tax=Mucilaginibacter sp. PPCGB 2223 TaxID=1886027 RepID=UPI000824E6A4|nr:hypothetical protein [Mucilaginibacter sp. PPCGB 2223]OCX54015.1 hypothetical protein BEL04_07000 [Mucilaginibacter sp. PPCGB 2223]